MDVKAKPARRLLLEEYTPEQRDKSWFYAGLLWPVLETALRHDVRRCTYAPRNDGMEFAVIEFEAMPDLTVNITGDSEWAVLQDVMSALTRLYG